MADVRTQLAASLGADYTILRELKRGGMSMVFVAREERLGREVVIKVLSPELAQGLSAERFTREIRVVAKLQEPHIVPVLAAGETVDRLPYYIMPYLPGESLRAREERGRIPLGESVAILRDLALALAYAHAHGIVHRDIKPENILLAGRTAIIADFGIAKAITDARTRDPADASLSTTETLTLRGMFLGTPAYMSPEQATGERVDQRTDVYAWGLIAYELLAGAHPFAQRTGQQLLAAQVTELPAPLGSVRSGLPADLVALVTRCLAKDPAERPQSGQELIQRIDALVQINTMPRMRALTPVTPPAAVAAAAPAPVAPDRDWLRANATRVVAALVGTAGIAAVAALALARGCAGS